MAAEVVLVPKEKYQKLLENHERILNDASDKDSLKMCGEGGGTQNKVDDVNDGQKEINIERDEKSDTEIHHQVKRKFSDMHENYIENTLKNPKTMQEDGSTRKLSNKQGVYNETINQFDDIASDLAVYKSTSAITKRQKPSSRKRRKKWLKYK